MTADDRRHADLDTLADLHARALEGPAAEQVRAHVAGCADCAATLRALDRVRDELHALPVPALPADVAARLDATVADLRAGRVQATPATPAGSAGDGRGGAAGGERAGGPPSVPRERELDELGAARLRRRRRSRALTAIAAAVAVLAAGASVTAIVRAGSGSTDSTTSSASGAGAGTPATSSRSGQFAPQEGPDSRSTPEVVQIPAYDRAGLRAALPRIRREHPLPGGTAVPVGAGAMADPARRTACAAAIGAAAGNLRAVAQISYEGQPAYVFVYEEGGGRLTGYVVSDQCGTPAALPAVVIDTVS
jgi:anti-sigma factor RsiW